MTATEAPVGLYLINLEVGDVGKPGAPIFHLHAAVYAPTGTVHGAGEITQALAPPAGKISVTRVQGQIHYLGLAPPYNRVVSLKGEALVAFPPPAIGTIVEPFEAVMTVDEHWNGHGSFSWGPHHITNVPVKKV
ncbi:MAG: DUF1842 domain-containing protein [Pseudomonadota bacterium]|jgi:hypothetical protein